MTTTAVALAGAWPVDLDGGVRPAVVEADQAGGDLAARHGVPHSPGLLDVAAAARRAQPGSLLGAASNLPIGVRAVLAPAGAGQCREAVRLLEEDRGRTLRGGPEDRGSVVVDVGRVESLTSGLVALADAVVLVCRAGVDSLAHVLAFREAQPAWDQRRVVLAVVGPCPYRVAEVGAAVGVERVVVLPWAPRSAAVLSGAAVPRRLRGSGWRPSALASAAARLAELLAESGIRREDLVGSGR
ncbi:hypothetical protein [Streptomyces profundus]|uniref:hypothetical protein n=1 Tax=Streptomyces profundus TaxID=2867410 RepID=UPI001D168FB4|nr:hypothetical protein [Streptomyces sp. MA3_2.13]UED86333.1 hypothetical protein K4G22_20800 [Streptomyces sp. MA3_2.13]